MFWLVFKITLFALTSITGIVAACCLMVAIFGRMAEDDLTRRLKESSKPDVGGRVFGLVTLIASVLFLILGGFSLAISWLE